MESYIIATFNSAGLLFGYKVCDEGALVVYTKLKDAEAALAEELAISPEYAADFVIAKITPV